MNGFGLVVALGLLVVASPGQAHATEPAVAGCPLQPADNVWNVRVDGLQVAANSASFITTNPRWNDDELVSWLRRVPGSAFEAVDVLPLRADPNSGQVAAIPGLPAAPTGLVLTSP